MGLLPAASRFVTKDALARSKATVKLRFGASVISPQNELHLQTGIYEFVRYLEEQSDGEINIQVIDKSQACAETTCGDRVANGIFDLGSSSPQNLGAVFPYSIALDWPFLWDDRTAYLNFLFSEESNKLYRDIFKKAYGIVPLYGSGEMRNVMLGLKYKDAPPVRSPDALRGAKIRITNSEMISNFAASMGMSPIPLAWTELLEGLKSGVVDGTETWPGAAVGFGMDNVLAQDLGLKFSPGFELVFMSARRFEKLATRHQELVLEASRHAMIKAYEGVAMAQDKLIGNGPSPSPESAYLTKNIKYVRFTDDELAEFRKIAGVEANQQLYSRTRTNLDKIAGFDVYGALSEIAKREAGKPLNPQKWWA